MNLGWRGVLSTNIWNEDIFNIFKTLEYTESLACYIVQTAWMIQEHIQTLEPRVIIVLYCHLWHLLHCSSQPDTESTKKQQCQQCVVRRIICTILLPTGTLWSVYYILKTWIQENITSSCVMRLIKHFSFRIIKFCCWFYILNVGTNWRWLPSS